MNAMTFETTPLARDIIKLSGPDTIPLLQGLLTANLDHLEDGQALYGALLTPQGKIIETMFLTQLGEDLYIDVPAGRGAKFMKKLMLYRLRAKVEVEDVTHTVVIIALPEGAPLPKGLLTAPQDPRHKHLGKRVLINSVDKPPTDDSSYLAHQLTLGISDMGVGFDEAEVFPLDINLDALNGIDHKKGCFVGQEVASRMFRKGEIRKRIYIIKGKNLSPGTSLKQNKRTIGKIRHAASEIGLAIIRLDRLDGETAEADGTPVTLLKPEYLS